MRSCFLYSEKKIFGNDIFMTIAKICIPAYYNSFRTSFFILVFNKDITDKIRNFLLVNYQIYQKNMTALDMTVKNIEKINTF